MSFAKVNSQNFTFSLPESFFCLLLPLKYIITFGFFFNFVAGPKLQISQHVLHFIFAVTGNEIKKVTCMLWNCEMWKAVGAKLWFCNVTMLQCYVEKVLLKMFHVKVQIKCTSTLTLLIHESEICKMNILYNSHFASLFLKKPSKCP